MNHTLLQQQPNMDLSATRTMELNTDILSEVSCNSPGRIRGFYTAKQPFGMQDGQHVVLHDNTPLIFSYLIFCLLVITGIKEEKEKNKR